MLDRHSHATGKQVKSKTKKIRVLVVDDHDLVRSGLISLLDHEEDLCVVGEACNGLEAIGKIPTVSPDVVMMDLKMPVIDGTEATAKIAQDYPQVRILVVSHLEHEAYIKRVIQLGASGFVMKSRAIEDLKEAIRVVHGGGRFISSPFAIPVDLTTGESDPEMPDVSLTCREQQVLRLIAAGRSTKQIAAELWISEQTVDFYEANLYEKVGVSDRRGLLQYAQRRNLMITDS